ncbi:DUF5711 family protein [Fumia xinanensis]|uniref:Uncharacterized protein n=1 Tax=Fumia xinanensis TaxID=2763659 RepID=A0A926E508_9FIRM|nr:hypothetical protein [Fumia xinanensis]
MKKENNTPEKQAKTYDIEEYRRKKQRKKWRNRLITGLTVVVILVGVAVGIYFYQNYDLQGLMESAKGSSDSEGTGTLSQSFPVSLTGITPLSISQSGDNLVLLTNEEEMLYSGGNAGHHFNHRFTNPVVRQAGGRILTYDRGGYGYRIDSGSGLHLNSRMENTILTGTISEKRSYAIVTKEARYAGSVTVYSKGNEEILKWYSASEQIADVAISPDDRYLAVACVGFEGGVLSSKLYVIDLKRQSEEAKAVITFSGALPVALDYKKNGQIHLVTDVGVGIVSKDFSSQRTAAYANGLYQYHFTNDRTYVLTTDTNSVSCSILMTDGETEKVATLKGEVLDVSDNGKNLFVLGKSVITVLDRELSATGTLKVSNDVYGIEAIGGSVYLLSSNSLDVMSADPEKAEESSPASEGENSAPQPAAS